MASSDSHGAPALTHLQRRVLDAQDAKLRRCRCCGEWAYHLDACTVCATPAQQVASA